MKCDYCGTTQGALITMCGMCRLEREPVETDTDWKDELIGELESVLKNANKHISLIGTSTGAQIEQTLTKIRDLKKQGKLSIRIGGK